MKQRTKLIFLLLFLMPLSASADQHVGPGQESSLNDLLFDAIAQCNLPAVRYYINEGADVNAQLGEHGDTPLILAIKCLHVIVSYYEQKIFSDPHTFTTAYANRIAIIRFLVFHPEIDSSVKNYQGESALSIATQEGINAVVELLLNSNQINALESSQNEINAYKELLSTLDIDEETYCALEEAIQKSSNSSSHEAGKQVEYLKFIFSLPWDKKTEPSDSIEVVKQALDEYHCGLQKVKDTILEHIAVSLLTPNAKTKILCLVGPPGTGKTSIAESIARGLNRNFTKISLGGVHEERAIRGHNKAYVGAEPGDILKGLKTAGSKNCVFLLDEIDKLGTQNQWSGNPAAALLEVLDKEQNKRFTDHYLDVPFDLSEVFFITTANSYDNIPRPLLDRMEVIELTSYTNEEKFHIAKKYLIPKALQTSGLAGKELVLSDDVLNTVIDSYTYEPGVRKLEEVLTKLCSKAARLYLETGNLPNFTTENLVEYLGAGWERGTEQEFLKQNSVGVSNALYWTSVKGGINFVETSIMPGKGNLLLTGNVGETWQESAKVALSYARSHAHELGLRGINFDTCDIHIHTIPSSGTEGPSAGAAILSSIVSALSKRPFNTSYAMTGELSLTGRILPIGGLKEKLLAAKKNGITTVIIPKANTPDLVELKDVIKDMKLITVSSANEVLNTVLLPPTAN